jgi:hypothetical protein
MKSHWQSRQLVVTPELLGLRSTGECQQRAEKLGLTPLPWLPYRQEYWRLDVLLTWSRANGFERLPALGHGSRSGSLSAHDRRSSAVKERT